MRRALLLAAVLLLAPAPALAKLDATKWKETEAELRALLKTSGTPERKIDLLKQVGQDGEPRAQKLVADALVAEAEHLTSLAMDEEKTLPLLSDLLAKPWVPKNGQTPLSPDEEKEMRRLQAEVARLAAAKSDEKRVVEAAIAAAVAGGPDYRKAVFAAGRTHKDWAVRAAVGRLAAMSADDELSKVVLADSLEKEKDPRVRVAALEPLESAAGTGWHYLVVGRIEDSDWGVQLVAVRIAGKREMGKAIPAMIRALVGAAPRLAEEIGGALKTLTGQSIEPYAEPWARWWEANKANWGDDGRPLKPVVAAPRPADVTYYGIKVRSDKVLFILDISDSMKYEKQAPTPPAPRGPVTGEPAMKEPEAREKFSGPKIEIAKQELRRVVKTLSKDSTFDIIAFNHTVTLWQPKMMLATDANKELAYAWIRDMAPAGTTFIDGALQMAFKMAGMGAYDKAYPGVAVDTIFLLSDGAPTDNGFPVGKDMDPNEILKHVQEWNSQQRIVINCVGIDNVVQGIDFMKKLAAQNGGTYVDG